MSSRRQCPLAHAVRLWLANQSVDVKGGVAMESLSSAICVETYMLYMHDDRYSVPMLDAVIVRDDDHAIEIAAQRLYSSPHHRIAELWQDDRLVCRISREDLDGPTT